jgi:4-aminobutyrate aminotransferase-like enzyme
MIHHGEAKKAHAPLASDIVNHLKDKGFLTNTDGALNNVVKIRPPLVFSDKDADDFLVAFDQIMKEINE